MTIYQPRRENISTWTISVEALKEWAEKELIPKAKLAFEGKGEYVPGPWCVFCKAAVKCRAPGRRKTGAGSVRIRHSPPLLTDAEIEEILGKLDDLTRWAEEIKAYAQDAALNHGKQWHGFKVVEGRSVRKYSSEEAVIEAANAAGYHDIFRKSLLPITEMEKLMGKQGFAEILGGLIVKPAGKPTLVPASDKRPAITNAKIDFNEIQED